MTKYLGGIQYGQLLLISGTLLYKYERNWKDKKKNQRTTNHLIFIGSSGKQSEEVIIPYYINYFRYIPQLNKILGINISPKEEGIWNWRMRFYSKNGEVTSDTTVNMIELWKLNKEKYNDQLAGFFYNSLTDEYVFIYVGRSINIFHLNSNFELQRSQAIKANIVGALPDFGVSATTFYFRGNTKAGIPMRSPDIKIKDAFTYFSENYFGEDTDLSMYIFDRGDHQILVMDRPGSKQFKALRFSK